MISADPLYLTALRNSHESLLRVTAYEAGEPLGELAIAACTLTLDGQGDIQRSATISVAVDQTGTDNRNTLERLTTRAGEITIEHGITAVRGGEPLGGWNLLCRLRVEDIERETGVALHVITAFDRTLLLQEHKLPTARPLDDTYLNLIKDLIDETLPGEGTGLLVDEAVDEMLAPAPGKTFGRGDDRLARIQEMAAALGAWLICDPDGSLHLAVWPEEGPNVWDISHGVQGTIVGAAEQFSRRETYNAVGIEFTPTSGDDFRGYVYLWDDDPDSPTYYDGPFGKRNLFYDEEWDHLPSVEEAERVARRKLAEHSGFTRGVTLTAIYNPLLLPGDRIVVRIPDEGPEVHVCDVITIELGPSATMNIETRFHRLFDPPLPDTVIPQPLIWLRGDDLDPDVWVNLWNDASGNNNHFHQALGLARPLTVPFALNGHQVVRFDGDDILGRPLGLDAPATVFVVARSTGGTGTRWAFSGSDQPMDPGEGTGGDDTEEGGYVYHIFREDDTFTVTRGGSFDYLIVGGGGGGGGKTGYGAGHQTSLGPAGGGGAGRVVVGTVNLSVGNYPVTVGEGGLGGIGSGDLGATPPTNGESSTFAGITAIGGGAGGHQRGAPWGGAVNALDGGSGGGGRYNGPKGEALPGAGSGNDGGAGAPPSTTNSAGGGGGAGEPGVDGEDSATNPAGGDGLYLAAYDIPGLGSPQGWFGGGGGGGRWGAGWLPSDGGLGGGGQGGWGAGLGVGPVPGTGGGGGGARAQQFDNSRDGSDGASGIVVIRHPKPPSQPGPR